MTSTIPRGKSTAELVELMRPRAGAAVLYQALLDTDTRPVQPLLREQRPFEPGSAEIPVERYLSQEHHDLEVKRLWKRVWQAACRLDEIPAVGDTLVYDIAEMSFIITRVSPTTVKAYANACLHRGRKLVNSEPCAARMTRLRCAFHGFTWDLEGSLAAVPASWDFPHVDFDEWRLPEARVGTWGGFVFINPDRDAEPFESFIGDLDRHFAPYDYDERYTAAHVVKVVPCNWKAAQEAFMESFHVVATHPQLLPQLAAFDVQYDAWQHYSRAVNANFLPSSFLSWLPTEQEIMDATLDRRLDSGPPEVVPDGKTAREVGAERVREALRPVIGDAKADRLCDAEVADSFYFTLFPNLHPWSAYNRLCFRFRPYGSDPNRAIQDIYLLSPYQGERPPAARPHLLGDDEDFTAAPELGAFLGRVLNQDLYNMPNVQLGLKAAQKATVTFSQYQESKIRHFHHLLNKWLASDDQRVSRDERGR